MNRPRILLLGGGGPAGHVADWARRSAAQADRRGIDLIVADLRENLPGIADLPSVTAAVECDYRDVAACRTLAAALHAERPLAAVAGFREFSLLSAASAAADLGLPWNSVEAIRTARTKDLCRYAVAAAGLPQPECHRVRTPQEAARVLAGRAGRWIVKPRDAFGSEGVQLFAPGDDVGKLVRRALAFSEEALVEEFVSGAEFSAEGILLAGEPHVLELTAKRTTEPPYFVELGHQQPAPLPKDVADEAVRTVSRAVRAVGLTHSLFHVEFWVTEDRRIICGEVHARTGGDWIHALTEHRRPGLDLFGSVFDDVLGRPVTLPPADPDRRAAVHVAVPPAGRLTAVTGADRAAGHRDCLAVDVVARPGQITGTLADSFGRGALVVAGTRRGEDPAARAADLAGQLRWHTEPVPAPEGTR
ncbi:ATP-grasp domain-containing protein [Streptomyces achromogenes]|uniref:ATP-grasp domain-containing protein n=1 Tax=Streptomyces achromogenes TaxID=67255 RepID=UPI0037012ED8